MKHARKKSPAQFPQLTERELQRLLRHAYRPSRRWTRRRLSKPRAAYHRRDWGDDEVEALGTSTDIETARLLGRTMSSVAHKRRRLGISPFTPQAPHWTKDEARLLGKAPDESLAKQLKRSTYAVATSPSLRVSIVHSA